MRAYLPVLLIFAIMGSNLHAQSIQNPVLYPLSVSKFSVDGKWGFKDGQGKIVIPPQFTYAGDFAEGLVRIAVGGEKKSVGGTITRGNHMIMWDGTELRGAKYGFVDGKGNMAIKPAFDDARDFAGGAAAVKLDGKWGYIDHTGKEVVKPQFEQAGDFSEGLAAVKKGGKWGFIDGSGKMVIEPEFQGARTFSEGLACVEMVDRFGYVDTAGNMIIKPRFDEAFDFKEGVAAVAGDVDRPNKVKVISEKVLPDGSVESELQMLDDNQQLYGFVDKTGKYVIEPKYEYAGEFHNGLAEVTLEGIGSVFVDHAGIIYHPKPSK